MPVEVKRECVIPLDLELGMAFSWVLGPELRSLEEKQMLVPIEPVLD